MKKLDWKGVGQFIAVFVKLSTAIVGVFKHNKVGIEVMEWLIEDGIAKLQDACLMLVEAYKSSNAYKQLNAKSNGERPVLTSTGHTFGDWLVAREKLHLFLTGETIVLRNMFEIPDDVLSRTDIMPIFRPVGASNRTAMDWKVRLGMNASYEEAPKVMEYRNAKGPQVPQLFYTNRSVKPDADTLGENAKSPDDLMERQNTIWTNLYGWSDADNIHFLITGTHLDSGGTWTWFPDDRLLGDGKVAYGYWYVNNTQANFRWHSRSYCNPDLGGRVAIALKLKPKS